MGEIFLNKQENEFVERVLRTGMGLKKGYKWQVLRFALARSLQITEHPADSFGSPPNAERFSELHLEQVTGEGKTQDLRSGIRLDFTDEYRLILSTYHGEDLFSNRQQFVSCLQKHIRRGIRELMNSWREGNDFHYYLLQEFFLSNDPKNAPTDDQELVVNLLARLGIRSVMQAVQHGPRLTRYVLRLDSSEDLDRLRKDIKKIPFELGYGEGISYATLPSKRTVVLDIPRPQQTWWSVDWVGIRDALAKALGALPVCPGTDAFGEPYVFDLADAPHLFVAGTTGSGKSQCVHALILSLLSAGRHTALALIDPKQVEFTAYRNLGSVLWNEAGVITDAEMAAEVLGDLVGEMERRQAEFVQLGAANFHEAEEKGTELPRIVVVVDELADLIMNAGDAATDPLIRLAQKARATGIHLILATQRPDAETFPGLLRSNIPSRIALTVQKAQESRIILDETGAEKLLMRGDMLIKIAGRRTVRAHGARVTAGDIAAAVR